MGSKNNEFRDYLKLDYIIAGLSISALVLLTVFGVIRRYVFNNPITWLEEMQMILIVWGVFFGGSVAFRKRCHVAIEIIVDAMPERLRKQFHVLIYLVTAAVLIFMVIQGACYIVKMASIGRVTSVLQIPVQYIYLAFPAGCLFMLVNFAFTEGKALRSMFAQSEEGKED